MASVALDADVLIAFLDGADASHRRAVELLRSRRAAGDRIVVAASVYAEILVHPFRAGTHEKVDEFLLAIGAEAIPIDREIARHAARLRASHRSLRLLDALSLATARAKDAQLLTLDRRLGKLARQA